MHRLHTFLSVLLLCGCKSNAPLAATVNADDTRDLRQYPHAQWRLASGMDLGRSTLWVSHVVIMHSASQPERTLLRMLRWKPDVVPNRSRDDAYRIACKVA